MKKQFFYALVMLTVVSALKADEVVVTPTLMQQFVAGIKAAKDAVITTAQNGATKATEVAKNSANASVVAANKASAYVATQVKFGAAKAKEATEATVTFVKTNSDKAVVSVRTATTKAVAQADAGVDKVATFIATKTNLDQVYAKKAVLAAVVAGGAYGVYKLYKSCTAKKQTRQA